MKISVFSSAMREIKQNFGRFASILAIVAIGVGFFSGVRASEPDMKESADRFFSDYSLMDLRLVSTYGFDEDDITALENIGGGQVYPGYFYDYEIKAAENDVVARIYSYNPNDDLNRVIIDGGRLPEAADECIIESSGFKNHLEIGDKIYLSDAEDMARTEFTIVGKYISPLFLSASDFGSTTVGDGSIDTAIYIPRENFTGEVFTQVYITIDSAKELQAYSDDYNNTVEKYREQIESITDGRCAARFEKIKIDATVEIADGRDKLADGEKELAEAKTKLEDAKAELDKAKIELDDAARQIADGEKQLADAEAEFEKQIADAENTLAENKARLDSGLAEYNAGLAEYDNGYAAYTAGLAELDSAAIMLEQVKAAYGEDSPVYLAALESYNSSKAELDAAGSLLAQTKAMLDETKAELDFGYAALSSGEAELTASKESGRSELGKSRKKLEESEEKYHSGLDEYNSGLAEYNDGLAEYNESEPDALADIAEAKISLEDAENKLSELKEPVWYVFTREDNPGYAEYGQNSERVGNIAKIFPVFFLLVAALVCITAMTRMVDEQRTQIGTLKALGYSGGYIMSKYMIYALLATLLGSAAGLAFGFQIFPNIIIRAYTILYNTPIIATPFRAGMAIATTLVALACVALTVFLSCKNELMRMPAKLMRPKSPPKGKRVLIERITPVWNRLNFSQKVSARNIFRYKKRMLMTVIGIAGCTALTLTGFGLKDSISDIAELQYSKIWHYDSIIATESNLTEEQSAQIASVVNSFDSDNTVFSVMQKTLTASSDEGNYDVTITVPETNEGLYDYITFQSRGGKNSYELSDEGVIINEKLAALLGLEIGDEITLKSGDSTPFSASITGIVENYIMNYVYITPSLYTELTGNEPEFSMIFCKYGDSDFDESALSSSVLKCEGVLQFVSMSSSMSGFNDTIKVLDLIVFVLIFSAGALAFVVLFNLNNINITERMREIATLKVLGFYDREVSMYIFRENIILTLMGSLLGLGLGRVLTAFVVRTAEIDMVMFGRSTNPLSYLYAFLITVAFSLIVSVVTHHSLKKVNMIDSLKSVE